MTVIRRQRSDNVAIIPNAVADDPRLSFAATGLLAYLLAKPNDWKVVVKDIQRRGGIGRDKTYSLLKELRDAGYIAVESKQDAQGRFVEHNYVVYDVAVPERLPLPENTEAAAPRPEKSEVGKPLPGKPASGKTGVRKSPTDYKELNIHTPLTPQSPSGFEMLLAKVEPRHRPSDPAKARSLFDKLPAPIDRESAIAHWDAYATLHARRAKRPSLIAYLQHRAWRELNGAPALDKDGEFIITPDREEWAAWLEAIEKQHGTVGVLSAQRDKRIVRPTRWPPAAQQQFAMALA